MPYVPGPLYPHARPRFLEFWFWPGPDSDIRGHLGIEPAGERALCLTNKPSNKQKAGLLCNCVTSLVSTDAGVCNALSCIPLLHEPAGMQGGTLLPVGMERCSEADRCGEAAGQASGPRVHYSDSSHLPWKLEMHREESAAASANLTLWKHSILSLAPAGVRGKLLAAV